MRLYAASSTALRGPLSQPAQPAECLGSCDSAVYFRVGRSVVAVLASDAVRLPCALVLPSTSAELPLTSLPVAGEARIGDGRVEWAGPGGSAGTAGTVNTVNVVASREWAPARARRTPPDPAALAALAAAVGARDLGIDTDLTRDLSAPGAAGGLLGCGPGLTPSGDDVLAGFMLGSLAFGCSTPGAFVAVRELAWSTTTLLSAQLLDHAAQGECIPEVAAVVAGLGMIALGSAGLGGAESLPEATQRLFAVGHTSGAALALGLVRAGERSLARAAAA
jgi:hypothetical protein